MTMIRFRGLSDCFELGIPGSPDRDEPQETSEIKVAIKTRFFAILANSVSDSMGGVR